MTGPVDRDAWAPAGPAVERIGWIDASAGIAGDMLLGALVDAGAPLDRIQAAIDAVAPGTVQLQAREVRRGALRATKVDVVLVASDQPSRTWVDIRAMLTAADLADRVRDRGLAVFGRLAVAEGRAHGTPPDHVHFHEVGAWDSIADIVGCVAALEELGIDTLAAGPVALGSGSVQTAHGELPVPVPAALELSSGWQVHAGGEGELATPTGLALVTTLASECADLPPMTVLATGVGAGTRDPAGRANIVRVVVGSRPADRLGDTSDNSPGSAPQQAALVIEANVDDLDPRVWPSVLAGLTAAGAADAWLTPILMKKGRPAHTLSVLASPDAVTRLRAEVFRLVPTFGVREYEVRKTALDRLWRPVEVDGVAVRIKIAHDRAVIISATPEFEDVRAAAEALGRPVRDVLDEAVAQAQAAGLAVGGTLPQKSLDT